MKRKWFLRAGFGLLAMTLLGVASVVGEWKVTRSANEKLLRAAVAKLDADEPGWRLHELNDARNARLPPADRNAGEQMLVALGLTPPAYTEWTKDETFRAEPVSNHLMDEDAFRAAAAVHAECGPALEAARRVRTLPEGGFAIHFAEPNPLNTPLANTQKMREGARLLSLDAIVQAYNKRPEEALQSCRASLNLTSGAIGDEPTLISQLVRMAMNIIAINEVERTLAWNEGPAGLVELQARLAAEQDVPRLLYGYRGERAIVFRLFENMDAGTVTMDTVFGEPASQEPRSRLTNWSVRKVIPEAQAYDLGYSNALIESTALADVDRTTAVRAVTSKVPPLRKQALEDGLKYVFLAAADKVDAAENRVRARLGCAVAALACERFRQKTGRWPETLQAIPADLLAAVPTDPYTGRPLLYRVHADGVTVYATGADKADDGGTNISQKDEPGTDLGFKLWNPALRRAAPVPKPNPIEEPE